MWLKTHFNNANIFFLISMHDFIFEHEINILSIKAIYLMGGFKSSYLFISLGVFITKMTRHHFLWLSVNLLSVNPLSHPKEIWGHWFKLRVLGGAELWWELRGQSVLTPQIKDYNNTYPGLKCILFILNLEFYIKKILSWSFFGDIFLVPHNGWTLGWDTRL